MKKTTSQRNAKRKSPANSKSNAVVRGVRLRRPFSKPIQIKHLVRLPAYIRPRRIHPRRTLPLVKEGLERDFHSTTGQVTFHQAMPALMSLAATDQLGIVTNTELTAPAAQQRACNVGEPSVAINGQVVFYTGNWYAAMSSDGGQTFSFIDPATAFPNAVPPSSNFCCDQVVQYISKIDTFVWLMQYGPETGDNIQRLAFASTSDVVQGKWRLFDLTTQILNVGGAFMDFPDLAVGANSLYLTTNIFGPLDHVGSAVIRISFSSIQTGQVTAQPFVSMDLQSFRVAQNCGTTAFFAAHKDTSTLALFSWGEAQNAPVPQSVGVARWIGGNGYQSRTPDGRRWLDRADPRITGATLAGNELWFAWSVDRGSNQRPRPFVQIARVDSSNLTLVENINIFDGDSAICYAALVTNANNEVGVSYMLGGGSRFPSHVIGILTGTRKDVIVAAGERGPLDPQTGKGEWGDYLTVRRVFPNESLFAATGYTMKGSGDGSNRDATPRFVVFGRASDATGFAPGSAGSAAPPSGGSAVPKRPPVLDGGPVTDAKSLPTVPPEVAAAIKAACVAAGQGTVMALPAPMGPKLVTKPGSERWPVKTGTDDDVVLVGKNVIDDTNFGAGIVEATAEDLIAMPRTPDMPNVTTLNPAFQRKRALPLEIVIWRIEATITALKLEADGDYHLVLQGATGETMIGEVPTPTTEFVSNSPWLDNIQVARQAVDDKLVSKLSPADFVFSSKDGMLVPRSSLSAPQMAMAEFPLPSSFVTPSQGLEMTMPTFKTQVPPTRARITGVGFFDKVHGQMGVSQANGIELHPVLLIEWL
jgi:hypothetical protein